VDKDHQSEAGEMVSERISDMTKQELEEFILQVVEKRGRQYPYVPKSDRTAEQIFQSILKNLIVPKPGTPSTLELLREDRDR
jgi:hypothetical protein